MKLTKTELRRIIKEEVRNRYLTENFDAEDLEDIMKKKFSDYDWDATDDEVWVVLTHKEDWESGDPTIGIKLNDKTDKWDITVFDTPHKKSQKTIATGLTNSNKIIQAVLKGFKHPMIKTFLQKDSRAI